MKCSTTEQAFQLVFQTELCDDYQLTIEIPDVKKIFKTTLDDYHMILDFKLKPAAIKNLGDIIRENGKIQL